MGKPTGFLEYERAETAHRPVETRIRDWEDFVVPLDAKTLNAQSARCMDCGVPFCHAGFVVDGLSIGCPLGNLIPEINDLVYRGETEKAWKRLSKTHPFPEFTSRVCPALCEGSCTLGEHESPVTVKAIERFITDEMIAQGKLQPRIPQVNTGKRVAVVGAGPSGLSCAGRLNKLGNAVTVFERADRPGGLLMYGIPAMKLPKDLVLNRAALMEEEGVRFILSTEIGTDYPVLALLKEYDAIVLCGGATQERTLSVPGSELYGVMTALDFLTQSTKNLLDGAPIEKIPKIEGKQVVIVGGGDTGTDCVATAIRRGAANVRQFEIMPRPGDMRSPGNPWPLWPKLFKTDYGQEEAIALFGKDPRSWNTTVKEILGDGKRVTGVKTVQVEWIREYGRLVPKERPETETELPADIVLSAMGFVGPEKTLIEQMNLDTDDRGNVATDGDSHKTSLLTVFAAGDMRRGPSLVVWAIHEGLRAAEQCHRYLRKR